MSSRAERGICFLPAGSSDTIRKASTVAEYIALAPTELRGKLKELRELIKAAAPAAEERISYGMPYYSYKGRVAYFAFAKNHIGLYLPTPIIEEHKLDLARYETSKATIRLPLDKKLPAALIKKLIRARVKLNEQGKKR